MSKKLFVGRLDFNVTNQQLAELFSRVGTVISATVIMDRFSGKSKGIGFVEMNNDEALKAIEAINGEMLNGREIVVSEARPRENREQNNHFNSKSNFNRSKHW